MRHSSTILLTGAILALTFALPAPASARIDRLCMKWLYFVDYNPSTGSYVFRRGRCLDWKTLEIPDLPRLFDWPMWAQSPGDSTPWITQREFNTLNPQPLPPV